MKITAPSNYTGKSTYGTTALEFKDGVAEVDEIPAGVRSYLQGAGYGIDGEPENLQVEEPVDPRDLDDGQIGTKLRDAAVDPRKEDFLAPTNAGQANPHGPDVVSPEIHGSQGVRPVKAGEVHVADTAKQDAAETEHAATATSGEPLPDTVGTRPAGNASQEVWAEYATAQGKDVEGLGRDAIRDLFN